MCAHLNQFVLSRIIGYWLKPTVACFYIKKYTWLQTCPKIKRKVTPF